jgi:multiple sugar transport system substrate-binding protein
VTLLNYAIVQNSLKIDGKIMNRREFIQKISALSAGTFIISNLLHCGENSSRKNIDLTFEVNFPRTDWTMGVVDPEITDNFRIMSWESEFQFKKWNLIINKFFNTYYKNMKTQLDWGISFANYNIKLPVLLAGGEPPDLVWVHDTRTKSLASFNLLQPLDPFIKEFKPMGWPEDYYPSQVKSFQYKNSQYGFPYDWASGGLYVNMDLYKRIDEDLPDENWTFDDILNVAKKLTIGKSQFGINFVPETNAGYTYWVVRSFGGDWFNNDMTQSKFNLPETIEAYQWLCDLRWKYKVSPLPETIQGRPAPFLEGNIAMDFNLGAPAFADLLEGKFDYTVVPTPRGPEGRFQFVGGSALAIPRNAKYKHIAYELIKYMLSNPENLKLIGQMGRMFVSRISFHKYGLPTGKIADKLQNYEHVFYELGRRDAVPVPYFHKYQEWEAIFRRHIELLYFGEELNAKKVCLKLHDDTNRFLESMNET